MSSNDSIRPFQIDIPEESLEELRRRVAVPRWPDRETVSDRTQGAQLAKVQELVDYWATDHDWRKLEAELNALPQFITRIDGLDIHFFHVRSPHANALPLIMTHGWPGSFLEFVKVIGPLTDPESHGARAVIGCPATRSSYLAIWSRTPRALPGLRSCLGRVSTCGRKDRENHG